MKLYSLLPLFLVSSALSLKCRSQQTCAGHPELCSKPFNKVSFGTTHNAYSYAPPAGSPALNQERSIQQQLDDGIRAFMIDTHKPLKVTSVWDKIIAWFNTTFHRTNAADAPEIQGVHLCHQSCALVDKGTLYDTLKVFRQFLNEHPGEIVTFIIENSDGFAPEQLSPSFKLADLERSAFVPTWEHSPNNQNYTWPTLKEMVDKDQRMVVFVDKNTDTAKVPYLLSEWDYVIETQFSNIHPVKEFPCTQDRPGDHVPRDLLVVNHFAYNRITVAEKNIDIPLTADQLRKYGYNSKDQIQTHLNTCTKVWGADRVPNFITLDYYDVSGSALLDTVNKVNGVSSYV
ncbi:hypothetical protein FBU59_001012 [Linderina macrospora]|uniref:Uncharacterized protein n=1 Tax=Linderina macrospora TaxID=4868 RepID=A0ACC1JF73_9FUNG|nr:hypothetical protein FBU59_001012 [Linderina macrospora]